MKQTRRGFIGLLAAGAVAAGIAAPSPAQAFGPDVSASMAAKMADLRASGSPWYEMLAYFPDGTCITVDARAVTEGGEAGYVHFAEPVYGATRFQIVIHTFEAPVDESGWAIEGSNDPLGGGLWYSANRSPRYVARDFPGGVDIGGYRFVSSEPGIIQEITIRRSVRLSQRIKGRFSRWLNGIT